MSRNKKTEIESEILSNPQCDVTVEEWRLSDCRVAEINAKVYVETY